LVSRSFVTIILEKNVPRPLEVENLSVMRNRVSVVEGLSFSLKDGETLALLGANGAGKTSAVEAIAGLLPKASGKVRLGDIDITRMPASSIARAGLGLVPQWRELFPTFTVEETLEAALFSGQRRNRQDVDDIYELFPKLGARRRQIVGTLSGGEQQMLTIGRALAIEPLVLVLDEPTAGLSIAIVNDLLGILNTIRKRGIPLVLVEQNISVAAAVADTCIVLSTGRPVWQGGMAHAAESDEVRHAYFASDRQA
jgi:branched-chain amino acid transport system ATP-binding protein